MTSISVIIPAHNAAKTIAATVDSILRQTRPVQEIVIVENGSTDNTTEVATELAKKHGLIKLIHSQPGVSLARNTGILACQGDYVAWIDADDTYTPDAMEVLGYFADKSHADFVKGNLLLDFGDTTSIWRPRIKSFNVVSTLRTEPSYPDFVGTVCALYRRDFLYRFTDPFPVGVRTAEDRAFIWKTLLQGATFIHVDRVIYNYDKTSESSVLKKVDGPHFDLFKAYGSVLSEADLTTHTPVTYKFWHSYVAMMHINYSIPKRLSDTGRRLWIEESRKAIQPIRNSVIFHEIRRTASDDRKAFVNKIAR